MQQIPIMTYKEPPLLGHLSLLSEEVQRKAEGGGGASSGGPRPLATRQNPRGCIAFELFLRKPPSEVSTPPPPPLPYFGLYTKHPVASMAEEVARKAYTKKLEDAKKAKEEEEKAAAEAAQPPQAAGAGAGGAGMAAGGHGMTLGTVAGGGVALKKGQMGKKQKMGTAGATAAQGSLAGAGAAGAPLGAGGAAVGKQGKVKKGAKGAVAEAAAGKEVKGDKKMTKKRKAELMAAGGDPSGVATHGGAKMMSYPMGGVAPGTAGGKPGAPGLPSPKRATGTAIIKGQQQQQQQQATALGKKGAMGTAGAAGPAGQNVPLGHALPLGQQAGWQGGAKPVVAGGAPMQGGAAGGGGGQRPGMPAQQGRPGMPGQPQQHGQQQLGQRPMGAGGASGQLGQQQQQQQQQQQRLPGPGGPGQPPPQGAAGRVGGVGGAGQYPGGQQQPPSGAAPGQQPPQQQLRVRQAHKWAYNLRRVSVNFSLVRKQFTVFLPSGLDVHTAMVLYDAKDRQSPLVRLGTEHDRAPCRPEEHAIEKRPDLTKVPTPSPPFPSPFSSP
jgi:hypothetical protein